MPTEGLIYDLPQDFGLTFINRDLSIELKKTFNTNDDNKLANYLEKFGAKPYYFDEVVNLVLNYYKKQEINIDKVKLLNKTLFMLFKNEEKQPLKWKNEAIPLINKQTRYFIFQSNVFWERLQ